MVSGGRRGVRGCLQGTVVRVVKVKLVTDVTEQPGRGELVHILVLTQAGGGVWGGRGKGEGRLEGEGTGPYMEDSLRNLCWLHESQ